MHVTKYSFSSDSWYPLEICEVQLNALNTFIKNTFARTEQEHLKVIPNAGYTNRDHFYEANGNYNLMNTCNVWVNKALKQAQVKTSIWSPFSQGILYHIKRE